MSFVLRSLSTARKFSTTALRLDGGCVPPGDKEGHLALAGLLVNSYLNSSHCVKPPNILVYDEQEDSFRKIKKMLATLLEPDKYVVYRISDKDFRSRTWHESTILLILRRMPRGGEALYSLNNYVCYHAGNLWAASHTQPWTIELDDTYGGKKSGSFQRGFLVRDPFADVIQEDIKSLLRNCFGLEVKDELSNDILEPTELDLLCREDSHLDKFLLERNIGEDRILFKTSKMTLSLDSGSKKTFKNLPVNIRRTQGREGSNSFDFNEFYNNLRTKNLGNIFFHGRTISSTLDITDTQRLFNGLLVVADRQVSGKGRSGNAWLSPLGCAMFTVQIHINLNREQL